MATFADMAIALGGFALVAALALLLGAANLGVALGIGQVGFAVVVTAILLRR